MCFLWTVKLLLLLGQQVCRTERCQIDFGFGRWRVGESCKDICVFHIYVDGKTFSCGGIIGWKKLMSDPDSHNLNPWKISLIKAFIKRIESKIWEAVNRDSGLRVAVTFMQILFVGWSMQLKVYSANIQLKQYFDIRYNYGN
jgi:hypothetical protein